MSSFICTPKHFNSVEKAICKLSTDQNFYFDYEIHKMYPIFSSHNYSDWKKKEETVSSIIDEIRKITCLCYNLQYHYHSVGTLDEEIDSDTEYLLNNKQESINLTDTELYKSIRCLLYQIEIEELLELRPLTEDEDKAMKFIKLFNNNLSYHIVKQTEEYETAEWGIE